MTLVYWLDRHNLDRLNPFRGVAAAGKGWLLTVDTEQGWTRLQIRVVALCVLINALDGMDVLIISYVAPALAAEWGVSFKALGLVFSAGLAGMMFGSLFLAPFADIWGRRPIILFALTLMTAGAIGSGLVGSLPLFTAMRLLTGLGIGTLLASVAALVSEHAPPGRRSMAIGIFQAGYPVGAVLTGLVAMVTIPRFGWQATLIGAGVMSGAIIPIVWALLPESKVFLAERQPGNESPPSAGLLDPARRVSTLALWAATFLSFAVLYFITSWIPKLAVESGLSQNDALWAGSIFNLGGVAGGLIIGWLAIRQSIGRLICIFFMICAIFMLAFAQSLPLAITLLIVFVLGLTLQGGFSGFYTLSAQIYPPAIRSAGIGWAVGIGRGGAVMGPLAGGVPLAMKLPLWIVFACFALPLVISGLLALIVTRPPPYPFSRSPQRRSGS